MESSSILCNVQMKRYARLSKSQNTVVLVIGTVAITATLGAIGFEAGQTRGSSTELFDVVLANGRVIDPETSLDAVRNVGIKDGRIAAVSATQLRGREFVDVKGLVVAPGFIDWHAHGQNTLADRVQAFDALRPRSNLRQACCQSADGTTCRREAGAS
jgi:hypothetical protein